MTTGSSAGERAATPAAQAWAARWSTVVALAAGGVALGAIAVASDPVGAVLAGFAALAVLAFAVFDAVARPSLTADPDGITVIGGWRPRRYSWADIDRIEVRTTRRLLILHALEIDAGDDLVLLTRRRLGADLAEVAARLADYRAAQR